MMERYPCVRYHRIEAPVTVRNAEEEQQLGKGWGDHPNDVKDSTELPSADVTAYAASLRERDRLADIARRQGR